ncbi:MAG: DUF2202 domain-containing protein [Ferruginibacter sp.]|nr:DUF2202 domain-containing protein [Ferruginibacter sp.]
MKVLTSIVAVIVISATSYGQRSDSLSENEMQGIVYMREEEKLARDIYDSLYAKWQVNPFGNIRKNEQIHMNRMKALIVSYKLADPVTDGNEKPGIFLNASLQKYYSELIHSGSQSLNEALKVGAMIEELDISDLNRYQKSTVSKPVSETYAYLKMASENHLRAFVRRLKANGINYLPIILTTREFEDIINTDKEEQNKCREGKYCEG